MVTRTALREFKVDDLVSYEAAPANGIRNGWRISKKFDFLDFLDDETFHVITPGETCLVLGKTTCNDLDEEWHDVTLLLVEGTIIAYFEHSSRNECIWRTIE